MPRNGASFPQRERAALCDLLLELGPDAPTLCEGWRSADLAAHLVTRDHRPDATPGMVVKFTPLARWTQHVQDGVRDTTTWDELVQRLRSGPPPLLKPLDKAFNSVEYFVHHEDLRRAQAGWEPRSLAAVDEDALWRRLRSMKVAFRSQASLIEAPDQPPIVFSRARSRTVVQGPVGELILWLLGRKGAARVEVSAHNWRRSSS
jgi:uncharacterized protein (TIGR03085 family)